MSGTESGASVAILLHRDCPKSGFGQGIVGPDGPRADDSSWHRLDDGVEIRAWKCAHCGVRFYAGVDSKHSVIVVPRVSASAEPEAGR